MTRYNNLEFAIKRIMLKIAICDQDKNCRSQILGFCERFFDNKYIEYELKEYVSGKSLLVEDFPDILFLSVEVEPIDGLLIKEILYKMRADTRIVFLSNHLDKMSLAFGKNVYAFLLKPILYKQFNEYMALMINDAVEQSETVYCKHKHKIEKFFMREVKYIKSYGKYTKIFIHGKKEYRISDYSFGEWYLEMENKEFVCCHRGYLVNIFYIKSVGKDIELIDEVRIPIGEKKKEEFFEAYNNYIGRVKSGIR